MEAQDCFSTGDKENRSNNKKSKSKKKKRQTVVIPKRHMITRSSSHLKRLSAVVPFKERNAVEF